MEKKRVVPVWVSVVLALLLATGIVLNVLYTITTYNTMLKISIGVFDLIACICALVYCLKGYRKNASAFFNAFCIIYCISCMLPIFLVADAYQTSSFNVFILLLQLIVFACLSIFAVSKDIGKRKSTVLAGTVLACTLINCGITEIMCGITGATSVASAMCCLSGKVILAVVFFIMVYAKYQDKAARGTK